MSHNARIPLISLINYEDSGLLDGMYYPDSNTRQAFIDYFLLEYGEFTPLYTRPDFLRRHIAAVAESLRYSLDTLYKSLSFKYNPIENYDRCENSMDVRTPDLESKDSYASNYKNSGTDTETMSGGHTDKNSGSNQTENQVSADNTGDYHPAELIIETPGDSTTRTYDSEKTTTDYGKTETHGGSDTNNLTGTDTNTHELYAHGNIGVTTTQTMIRQEREIAQYNFFEMASRMYAEKLLILIY